MPKYLLTFKPEATEFDVQEAKDEVKAKGGRIIDEFALIKGFSFEVEAVKDNSLIQSLGNNPKVKLEKDQIVTTQ